MKRFNFIKVLITFVVVIVNCSVAEQNITNSKEGRKPKLIQNFFDTLLPYFVNIANDPCLTIDGTVSTCLRRDQCSQALGVPKGPCAKGLAVCCELNVTCKGQVTQNLTWFRNPMYPKKITTSKEYSCPLHIKRPENVGQLLLNIYQFETLQVFDSDLEMPEHVVGSCQNDTLTITGSDVDIPKLCGNLTNQHIYLNFDDDNSINLNLFFAQSQIERTWNIQLVFIPFDSPWRAPPGCLQYFTGLTGRVMSFNYPVRHLASLSYTVCIRTEHRMTSIKWSGCKDTENQLPVDFSTPMDCGPNKKAHEGSDYITIMDGQFIEDKQIAHKDRFCSSDFNAENKARMSVKSKTRPFLLRFTTDDTEKDGKEKGFKGFCLKFEQSSK